MKKQHWKASSLLNPVPPVMVSCGDMKHPNIITIAWAGTICSQPNMVSISIRPERFSYPIIHSSKQFVINLATEALVPALDWCGVRSGWKYDKFAEMGLHATESQVLDGCPVIAESPVNLECKVTQIIPLGSHDLFLAEVVGVSVSEELLDDAGKLCLEKANLVAYSHGEYFALGEKLGSFGYSVKKPAKKSAKNLAQKAAKKETK